MNGNGFGAWNTCLCLIGFARRAWCVLHNGHFDLRSSGCAFFSCSHGFEFLTPTNRFCVTETPRQSGCTAQCCSNRAVQGEDGIHEVSRTQQLASTSCRPSFFFFFPDSPALFLFNSECSPFSFLPPPTCSLPSLPLSPTSLSPSASFAGSGAIRAW